MIAYRKGFFRVAEVWFDEPLKTVPADILRCVQRSEPRSGGVNERFHTLVVDLRDAPDRLVAKMKRETRYEIRRASEKDRLAHQFWSQPDDNCLQQFTTFYDRSALEKDIPRLNTRRIRQFKDLDALVVSMVCREDTELRRPLVWHSYYRSGRRARLLHSTTSPAISVSSERSLLGRANRFLHWQDMLEFRTQGVEIYDLGGWYEGHEDSKKIAINHFKEGFGGEMVLNYNCLSGVSPVGIAAIWMYSKLSSRGHAVL